MGENVELSPERWAPKDVPDPNITSGKFTFDELATATLNFSNDFFLGAGGFARVYKGYLQDGQVCSYHISMMNAFVVKVHLRVYIRGVY